MTDEKPPLAEKDAFPTPLMKDEEDKVVVWPGGGLNALEYATIHITAGLAAHMGHIVDDAELALMGYRLGKATIRRLEARHEEELPEEDA